MAIFDWFKAKEQETKLKNMQQLLENKEAILDFQKFQKRIREKMKAKEELDMLKDLVSAWFISKQSVENIMSWEILSHGEIHEMLEKIQSLQELNKNNKILPKWFMISSEEYLEALWNFEKKKALLQKIDMALDTMYLNIGWSGISSPFWVLSYNLLLSKTTQQIQWNLIDIKNDILSTNTL